MIFPELTVLKTERLVLRKLTLKDVPAYYERLGSSETVTRYMLFQPHRDISESVASIQKVLQRYEAGKCSRWGIALKEDDSLIGMIELLRFNEETGCCSFAYMLAEAFWGQGYGTETLKAAFDFAFRQMEVHTIIADHMTDNPASGAAMRKAGMFYVNTIPGAYEKGGRRYDAAQYQITKEQWLLSHP